MKYLKMCLVVALLIGAIAQSSFALPRFALMTGYKCGACHVNPTGGQMRTDLGTQFSQDHLPLVAHRDSDFTFSPKLTDNITIGGDYRGQYIYDFATDPNDGVKGKNTFHGMTATIYGAITLSKKVSFYFKQDLLNPNYGSYSGPEVFGIVKALPNNGYIKGGIFLPDYGWRVDDHTSYIRGGDVGVIPGGFVTNGLFFTPNYKDVGLEAGMNFGDLFVNAGLFNGTGNFSKLDFSTDKAYSAKVEYMGKSDEMNFRLGVSGYGYKSYKMAALDAGIAYGDWVLYGEMDWTHHKINFFGPIFEGVNMSSSLVELDYQAMEGLWIIGKYDMFDPLNGVSDDDLTPATNSVKRVTLGLELFPYSFVEIRPQYRIVMEKPSADNDQLLVQMHLWF